MLFNVGVALSPILSSYLISGINSNGNGMARIFAKGELLVIAAAINAGALGEIIGTSDYKIIRNIAGGACTILIIVSCIIYSIISSESINNLNANYLKKNTISILIASLLASSVCIWLSEGA